MRIIINVIFCRGSPVGNHVLLRMYVSPGQLLCVHDLLPCMRFTGAGGKAQVLCVVAVHRSFVTCSIWCVSIVIDVCFVCKPAVQREPRGPSHLAAEPLLQSDGGGGQQAQPRHAESQDDHGESRLC